MVPWGNQMLDIMIIYRLLIPGSQINYSFGNDQKITGLLYQLLILQILTWEKVLTYNAGLDIACSTTNFLFSGFIYS